MRAVLLLLSLAACGDDMFESFQGINGAPIATRGLGFDPKGRAVIAGIGGGPGAIVTREGDWVTAQITDVSLFGSVSFYRRHGALYAGLSDHALKLDDVDGFGWTLVQPIYGQIFGVDDAERLYSSGPMSEIRRLAPGDTEWTPYPGTATMQIHGGMTVTGDGTVFFNGSFNDPRVYRATPEGTSVFADCSTTEGCASGLGVVGSDGDANLYMLECPQIYEGRDHRFMWKSAHGTDAPTKVAKLPDRYPYCVSTQVLEDGTVFLVMAVSGEIEADMAIFELAPGGDTWEQATADDPDTFKTVTRYGYNYVARDRSTIWGWGDGNSAGGVVRATR